jgi:hypothetical protein
MSNRFRFRFQNFSFSNKLQRQREWRDVIPLPLEAVPRQYTCTHHGSWHQPLAAGGIRLRVAAASQRADGAVPLPLAVRVPRRQCGACLRVCSFPRAAGVTRTRRGEGQQARARGQALSQPRRRPPHSPSRPIQVPRPRALHENPKRRIGPCQTIRASAGDPRPAGRAWPAAPACIARGSVGSCTGQAAQCSLGTTSVYHFFRWGIPDKEPERKAFSALFAALLRVEHGFIWVDAPCPSSGTGQGGATVPKANRRDGLVGCGRRSSLDNADVA